MPDVTLYQPTQTDRIVPEVYKTPIDGLYYLPRTAHSDARGFYAEVTRIPEIEAVTHQSFTIKQINLSFSKTNVIRGFHAENWNKLLTVTQGTSFCAWADFRPESPTFGKVVTMWVGDGEHAYQGSVFVSSGIGNSFCVTQGPLYYMYMVDQLYSQRDASGDKAISLFDPDLGVQWPIPQSQMVISDRDRQSMNLRTAFPTKF